MPRRYRTHQNPRCEVGRADAGYDRKRYSDPVLARSAGIRNSYQWQKVRSRKRAKTPFCFDPYKSHDVPVLGESIHHVFPLEEFPELAFVEENLANLCWYCHNRADADMSLAGRRDKCLDRFLTRDRQAALLRLAEEVGTARPPERV